ncbi:hypothetical protein SAMN02982989_4042 [Xaviernesmea oryzae]|uniref:Uncharacterized protein n=1 Tax=Xaviernesmea oryzae TaxID=464029 RepID=A0A1X7GN69_9HYPH|nr:hypothetical protein [Xaviernesmea oryzae]SMF71564.1 hypothetical protein SAMN02982989_4042 [Xaviernesmea oryzae]
MTESTADASDKEERRLVLVNNERRKLIAGALDRLSTAFVAVGVLGQVLSLSPASASVSQAVIMAGWILGAVILHWIAQRALGGLKV